VLLLGGQTLLFAVCARGMAHHIPLLWKEQGIELSPGDTPEELIKPRKMPCILPHLALWNFAGRDAEIGQYLERRILSTMCEWEAER